MTTGGTLYICGTPIGNLEDITFRVKRTLEEAALIAAEDTRQTSKLLNYYGINTRLVSYHEHNKREKGPQLIKLLLDGTDIALVSDAGMPGISDPGEDLVKQALAAGIKVVPIPGPTAAMTGLVVSGLSTSSFYFGGFLPRKRNEFAKAIAPLKELETSLIFYEAPHRLMKTLEMLSEFLGNREIAICRELTKRHEEIIRGRIDHVREIIDESGIKGEITLIVGPPQAVEPADTGVWDLDRLIDCLNEYLAQGIDEKDAIKKVVKVSGLARNDVYQGMVELKSRLKLQKDW